MKQIFIAIVVIIVVIISGCNKEKQMPASTVLEINGQYNMDELLNKMIALSLEKIDSNDIYTFSFYHDHESNGISICIDTKENSEKKVNESNGFTKKYFYENLNKKDMNSLKLWNFQTERNFSLGDFAYTNCVYAKFNETITDTDIYYKMILAIERNKKEIFQKSKQIDQVSFSCSSEENEVQYIWK